MRKSTTILSILAVSLALNGCSNTTANTSSSTEKLTYSMVDTKIDNGLNKLNIYKREGKKVYLVLHRTGCPDCEKVTQPLVKSVKKARSAGKTVFVLDLAKMNSSQLSYLKTTFPSILINGKLPTPSVLKLKASSDKSHWDVVNYSNNGNIKEIESTLDK